MNEFYLFLLGIVLLVVLLVAGYFSLKSTGKWKSTIKAKLKEIDAKYYNSSDINILKSGLVEIDKLYDHTLKMSGYKGETMGERLKNAKKYYEWKQYNEIWEAHKYRNRLVHEFDFVPIVADLKKHYSNLRRAVLSLL